MPQVLSPDLVDHIRAEREAGRTLLQIATDLNDRTNTDGQRRTTVVAFDGSQPPDENGEQDLTAPSFREYEDYFAESPRKKPRALGASFMSKGPVTCCSCQVAPPSADWVSQTSVGSPGSGVLLRKS